MSKKRNDQKGNDKMDKYSFYISVLAILISIVTGYFSIISNDREYRYKLSPKIDITGNFNQKLDPYNFDVFNSFNLKIIENNNLEKILIIDPSNNVKSVTKEKMLKKILNEEINSETKINATDYDIFNEGFGYKYRFILLVSQDENIDVYLILYKLDRENSQISFYYYNENELYSLSKKDFTNNEFYGEKRILNQYKDIIQWYRNNKI